jgi:hypothetical protein
MEGPAASGRFRRVYGAGPLHLLSVIAGLAIATYAFLEVAERPSPLGFAVWFAGAIVAHDLIAFPLYSALGLLAGRAGRALGGEWRAINYVRVPAIVSALLLVVWFPFVFGLSSAGYQAAAGRTTDDFAERWLLITAALFALSGVVWALRARLGARRPR